MNEIEEWMAAELIGCEAKSSFQGGIETLEIACKIGNAEHIERGREEPVKDLFGQFPFGDPHAY